MGRRANRTLNAKARTEWVDWAHVREGPTLELSMMSVRIPAALGSELLE